MRSLFEEVVIGRIPLRNRIVRSATWEGMCEEDGAPTERLIALYEGLADGGVGLIITGYAYARPHPDRRSGEGGIPQGAGAGDQGPGTYSRRARGGTSKPCRTGRNSSCGRSRLLLDGPSLDPGTRPGEPVVLGGPIEGALHLLQRVLSPRVQGGRDLLRG